ncbi:MAG: flagellar biosynthesis protein FlhA, partial [Acidimicrobiales bacterium]|nr:flagellar biosynthesis protein FlhA [Acidimicrobiales bacterium]
MTSSRVGQIGIPAAVVAIVCMLVVPLPPFLLDLLLVINIAGSILILLVSMQVQKALDFAVFPSLLLVATLFRLALNVSATRLVLLHGHAGNVIAAFGSFVVGGSVVVGLVIFLILIVIQFIVITNGAGRVAEVGARFTLDAMPGKQMSIDADLNAGLITEDEARRRRAEISAEADFYGAMDGASKFVKGDAVAAIVITTINLFGGFLVGVMQRHLPFGDSVTTYSLLSIGDGLVSQIPALLISISTGIIVTRATTDADMGSDVLAQFARQRQALRTGGVVICLLALVPGLPKVPFLVVGGLILVIAARLPKEADRTPADAGPDPADAPLPVDPTDAIRNEMKVEPLELEISYDLVDLVDAARGGDLLDRVRALRRKLALELGMVIPLVRTRDNLDLPPHTYAIRVHGVEMGRGEAPPGTVLAIADDLTHLPGTPTTEPVFGLAARWVPIELRQQAELMGATVVDRSSVVTTHLAEVVRQHAGRLLGRQDVKALVDMVKASDPAVVEELTPNALSLAEIQRILQLLLEENVAIRDLVRIFEVLSERARVTKDPEALVEAVRGVLGPAISAAHATDGRLQAITFEPLVEQSLLEALRSGEHGTFLAIDPAQAERLAIEAATRAEEAEQTGASPVLLCSAPLRPAVRRLTRAAAPRLPVLSYAELGTQLQVETIGVISLAQT